MGRAPVLAVGHGLAVIACLFAGCAGGDGRGGSPLSGAVSVGSAGSSGAGTSGNATDTDAESDAGATTQGDPDSSGAATTVPASTDGGDTDCEETTWYLDGDGDGRGSPLATTLACTPPPGYVPFGDDCDDADPNRSPAAMEVCNAIDDDCDALVDDASEANGSCNGCNLFDIGGRSYALCPAGATFDAARSACAAFTGDLLRLDDETEQAAVVALPEPPAGPPGGWVIGLSDSASEGSFVWTDGVGPAYTNWNAGEPNDAGGNEDCTEMDLAVGIWNDVPCVDPRAFICESPGP